MAVIKRNEEQEIALQKVNELLRKLDCTNLALDALNKGAGISLSVDGKRGSITVNSDKGRKNVAAALAGEQAELRKAITATSKKHNIALSEEDEAILKQESKQEEAETFEREESSDASTESDDSDFAL